jgi:hypothetical protein
VNTSDSSTHPSSSRLRTVKDLLEQLSSMKSEGLGARERLDFLREEGPELVKDFSFEDAFDAEARTRYARLEHLDDLAGDFRELETSWSSSPLPEDVRQAGSKLFKHLAGFVGDAQAAERHSEIEMLSQIWDWAPDIRWLYPWLTAWTGAAQEPPTVNELTRRYGVQHTTQPKSRSKEAGELSSAKAELDQEVVDANLESSAFDALEREALRQHELVVKESGRSDEMRTDFERQTWELDQGEHVRRDFEVKRAEEDPTSSQVPHPGWNRDFMARRAELEKKPEDPARVRQEAWTQSLRDVTLETWSFRIEAAGHLGAWGQGTAMIWKHGLEPHSSARLEWAPSRDGHVNVRLFASSESLGSRELKREMSEAQLAELHVDPSSFVAEVLGPK